MEQNGPLRTEDGVQRTVIGPLSPGFGETRPVSLSGTGEATDPADSLVSPVPLHPKVKDYLRPMMATLRFQIGDALPGYFVGYNSDDWAGRKSLYVTWSEIHNPAWFVGGQDVMVFDQITGELLYHGPDGGE